MSTSFGRDSSDLAGDAAIVNPIKDGMRYENTIFRGITGLTYEDWVDNYKNVGPWFYVLTALSAAGESNMSNMLKIDFS